jgi:hypothetical protein
MMERKSILLLHSTKYVPDKPTTKQELPPFINKKALFDRKSRKIQTHIATSLRPSSPPLSYETQSITHYCTELGLQE